MTRRRPTHHVLQVMLAAAMVAASLPATTAHELDTLPTQDGEHGQDVDDSGFWNIVTGFTIKDGRRLVFAWDADAPIAPLVRWGPASADPDALPFSLRPPGDILDTAGVAFLDIDLTTVGVGTELQFRVEDEGNPAVDLSPAATFRTGNAMKSDISDGIYEVNLVVALDTEAAPDTPTSDLSLADIQAGIDIFAERVWDMTDGYMRIGNVLVMDRVTNHPTGLVEGALAAGRPLGCPVNGPVVDSADYTVARADILIETTIPVDSHTWAPNPAGSGPRITDPCTGIYVGREGWMRLGTEEDPQLPFWVDDLDLGATLAHEFGHYALGADDLYPGSLTNPTADCLEGVNGLPGQGTNWDISVMHDSIGWNGVRWIATELDRPDTICDTGTGDFSWNHFTKWYATVPAAGRNGNGMPDHFDSYHDQARDNPDGSALNVYLLDREPGLSKLAHSLQAAGDLVLPEAQPGITITEPVEGQVFNVDRIQVKGFVDRGYPDLPLLADAHGPYSGIEKQSLGLIGTATNGVGPYRCTWSTKGPAIFGDVHGCSTWVTFNTPGSFLVTLTVIDTNDLSQASDSAKVQVEPAIPIPPPPGCGDYAGRKLATDSNSDQVAPLGYAAELTCLGADMAGGWFSLQLSVRNKDLVPIVSPVPPPAPPPSKTQSYLVTFTPDFGKHKDVRQWIYLVWDVTPDPSTGMPRDVLTPCWLVLPPGPLLAPPVPDVRFLDYSHDCDPTRTVRAQWLVNTMSIDFPISAELGLPKSGDHLLNVYGEAFVKQAPTVVTSPSAGIKQNDKTQDLVPDAKNAIVTFDGPDAMVPVLPSARVSTPVELPVDPGVLPGSSQEAPQHNAAFPEVTDPDDVTLDFMDILAIWVENEMPGPTGTFDVVMRVQDLSTMPPVGGAIQPLPSGLLPVGVFFTHGLDLCLNNNDPPGGHVPIPYMPPPTPVSPDAICYGLDVVKNLNGYVTNSYQRSMDPQIYCGPKTPPLPILVNYEIGPNQIRFRLGRDRFNARVIPNGLTCAGLGGGGGPIIDGTKLTMLAGNNNFNVFGGVLGLGTWDAHGCLNLSPVCTGTTGDIWAPGDITSPSKKTYIFGKPPLIAEAGPNLGAIVKQTIPITGSYTGGIPAHTCTWSAPGGSFTPDPVDPTGCIVAAKFTICGPITVTLTVQDSNLPPTTATDTTIVVVTGCIIDPVVEFVDVYAQPIQPAGAPPVAPKKLNSNGPIVLETGLGQPRAEWGLEWSGLTEADNGYWMLTAQWFDKVVQQAPIANATVNITIALPRIAPSQSSLGSETEEGNTLPGEEDVDPCSAAANSGEPDLDGDGIVNGCDDDIDGDGWLNFVDNCVYVFDREMLDHDRDGKGDVCDDNDDNDVRLDTKDNCVFDANPTQEDLDADGLGDFCDDDRDGDTVADILDHFPDDSSEWLDFDHDKLGDNLDPDDDNDGLGDELEDAYGGHNAARLQVGGRDGASLDSAKESPGLGLLAGLVAVALAMLVGRRR